MVKELDKSWTFNCESDEEKEEIELFVRNNSKILGMLEEIIERKIKAASGRAESKDCYNDPNWAAIQADTNGYVRGLKTICNIVQL